ncbi:hypothetical cytosolic protein [Coxiella burnetii CbuG_Q212]|nr:hypothetical cytosolic protein [Coxiella burnetii CbuG_Q212]
MWVMIWYGPCRYPPVLKREKLKTRRPPARPSALLLKDTKPSRPSREDPD